jgi:hypothetical protein
MAAVEKSDSTSQIRSGIQTNFGLVSGNVPQINVLHFNRIL